MFKKDYPDDYCPQIKDSCIKGKCHWWLRIVGTNPNTGQPVDNYDCNQNWIPLLQIETSQQVRQGAAAVESFRNEVVKRQDAATQYPLIGTTQIEALNGPRRS